MGTRTTKKLYQQVVREEGDAFFGPLGFIETSPAVFFRQRGEIEHGFFLMSNPSYSNFHVLVGANVPALDVRHDYIAFGGAHYATLIVDRPLGLLGPSKPGERKYYHFATAEEMRQKFPMFYADFVREAEPWLARLVTIDAIAKEFYKWRIGPPSTGETRRADPFAWALYGWLLQVAGLADEARQWLAGALDEVMRPQFGNAGKLVPAGTKGARLIPRSEPELRLQELLEKEMFR